MDVRLGYTDFFFGRINFEQAGLYHVCYPPERLEILTENIQDGLLSVEDRIVCQ